MICMIDNYDSFTYNIVNYIKKCGEDVEVYNNDDPFESIDFSRYSGIVLSPGPSTPQNSGITLDVIRNITEKPLLGICLGMQAMGLVFGGTVMHAKKTMHGKIDTVSHTGGILFKDIPEHFDAVRYHSLVVQNESLPEDITVNAYSSDGEVMALFHNERPVFGVQFHPESYLSGFGLKVIENFIEVCNGYKKAA
jgi:anthranilate synthase/aminodeoxychorismate synthase-like glutamine amidotransferase